MMKKLPPREIKKRMRVVLAVFLLAAAAALAVLLPLYPQRYAPVKSPMGENGFAALCYAGVNRRGENGAVSPEKLREQLGALQREGYVTIGKEEIGAYREKGAPLPEKALYIAFADGGAETALLADRVLRELNFKGAFPAVASNSDWDYRGMPKPLLDAYLQSGFWEKTLSGFSSGAGVNRRESGLTWLCPNEDWSVNNLLMRLAKARGDVFPLRGVAGWDTLSGCMEADGETLTLTSPAGQAGMTRLQWGGKYGDWRLKMCLLGGGAGEQAVYLRADAKMGNFIRIGYAGGVLTGTQRENGADETLFSRPVSNGEVEISLSGGELIVRQDAESVAWNRTTVKNEGYIYLEAVPQGKDAVYDGVFRISVFRPEGETEREVYSSVRPLRQAWDNALELWHGGWNWLRTVL